MSAGNDLGADVGTKLHVVIRTPPDRDRRTRALFIDEVAAFADLGELIDRYQVRSAVVDALPEGHGARQFATRYPSRVWLAFYDRQRGDHEWAPADRAGVRVVHANRTLLLEETFDRFHRQLAELPRDARSLGGQVRDAFGAYYRQVVAPVRVYEQDADGELVARYIRGGKDDHYAHAEAYCLLASRADRGARLLTPITF